MTAIFRENFNWWPLQTGSLNASVIEDQSVKLEGRASGKCQASEASRYQYTLTAVVGEYIYYRTVFRFVAKPAVNEGVMRFRDATGTMGEITFRASGKFNFFNSVKATNIGGESPEATLGKFYVIEAKIKVEAAGASKIGWRILNEDGSTFFAEQFAEQEIRNTGVINFWSGHMGSAAIDIWIDMIGANNSKGSVNNTWLGSANPSPPSLTSTRCYQGANMDGDVALLEGKEERGDAPYNPETWNLFESHQGRKVGIVHFSDPWRLVAEGGPIWDGFGVNAALKCYERGAIACKTIGSPGTNIIKEVNEGKYDAQLKIYYQKASEFKHPYFQRLWWEMNGNWWVWSTLATSSEYIAAWQRVYTIAQEQGATNATFFWCPNEIYGAEDPEAWYPGDAYVHWVGFDAYNGEHPKKLQGWRTAPALLGPTYERLLEIAPTKPQMIGEIGCSEYKTTINNSGNKAPWLEELLAELKSFPGIKALMYYNEYAEHSGGRVDWPIESYPGSETTNPVTREAYAKGISSPYYIGPTAENLSDLSPVPEPSLPGAVYAPANRSVRGLTIR